MRFVIYHLNTESDTDCLRACVTEIMEKSTPGCKQITEVEKRQKETEQKCHKK